MSTKRRGIVVAGLALAGAVVAVALRPYSPPPAGAPDRDTVTTDRPLAERIDVLLREEAAEGRLSADRNTPWELVHAALALGMDTPLRSLREPQARTLHDYFFAHPRFLGETFYDTSDRGIRILREMKARRYESHAHEFLAIFALAGVPPEQPIALADDRRYTVRAMLDTAKREYSPGQLPSFLLIAVVQFDGLSASWVDRSGATRSVADLVEEQLRLPPDGQPCGGSHGLLALAVAADALRAAPDQTPDRDALRRRIEAALAAQRERCLEFQRADGSLSPKVFAMTDGEDLPRRVFVTGHTLEWLVRASDPDTLTTSPFRRMAEFLVSCSAANGEERGSLGEWFHALHALRVYRSRAPKALAAGE